MSTAAIGMCNTSPESSH